MTLLEQKILLSFLITLLSELVIVSVIQNRQNWRSNFIAVFAINCFTHPLAIYLLHVQNFPYLFVEFGILLIEAFWYKYLFSLTWERSFILSAAANIFSILLGVGSRQVNTINSRFLRLPVL